MLLASDTGVDGRPAPGRIASSISRLLLVAAVATSGCDTWGGDRDDLTGPGTNTVLLDTIGTLPAVALAADTFELSIPENRVLGVIFESSHPIAARWGGTYDVVWSGLGGTFAAIVSEVGAGPVTLRVFRAETEVVEVDYRLRVVGVDEGPEHIDADIGTATTLRREWIDAPLDLDVFALEFDVGDRFFIESESDAVEAQLTMRIVRPGGAAFYPFIATGPQLARSDVIEAQEEGEHLLMVYTAGLVPDVTMRYRFRVMAADESEQ